MKIPHAVSIVLTASFLLVGCNKGTDFESSFERAAASGSMTTGASIRLSSMTPFSWDKVFIFHPYTAADAIDEKLGFKWSNSAKSEIEWRDSFQLLVFVKDNRVVQYARIRRNVGDWDIEERNGFSPAEAILTVEQGRQGAKRVFHIKALSVPRIDSK